MEIKDINVDNIYYLENFLINKFSNNFRYFNKRDKYIIINHIITLIGIIDNKSIAYGHIDYCKEEDKYWLGICILDEYCGKGYGKQIMNELINKSIEKNIKHIYLSVDKDNITAYNLYLKYGFKIKQDFKDYLIMNKILE